MSGILLPDPWRWVVVAFFVVMFFITATLMILSYLKGNDKPAASPHGGDVTIIGPSTIKGGDGGSGGSGGAVTIKGGDAKP